MRAGDITVAIEIPPNFGRESRVVRLWNSASGSTERCRAGRNGKRLRAGNAPELATGCGSRQSTPASQSGLMNIETRYRITRT